MHTANLDCSNEALIITHPVIFKIALIKFETSPEESLKLMKMTHRIFLQTSVMRLQRISFQRRMNVMQHSRCESTENPFKTLLVSRQLTEEKKLKLTY